LERTVSVKERTAALCGEFIAGLGYVGELSEEAGKWLEGLERIVRRGKPDAR
jgi:hypothetical protein